MEGRQSRQRGCWYFLSAACVCFCAANKILKLQLFGVLFFKKGSCWPAYDGPGAQAGGWLSTNQKHLFHPPLTNHMSGTLTCTTTGCPKFGVWLRKEDRCPRCGAQQPTPVYTVSWTCTTTGCPKFGVWMSKEDRCPRCGRHPPTVEVVAPNETPVF